MNFKKKLLPFLAAILTPLYAFSQSAGPRPILSNRHPSSTYAARPTANLPVGYEHIITDGLNTNCGAGGGTTVCLLRWNGSAYQVLAVVGGSVTIPGSNNQVLTSDGTGNLVAESGLTYDGSVLTGSGTIAGFTNILYLNPSTSTTFQPTADVGFIEKCANVTNTIPIKQYQTKTGDPILTINCDKSIDWGSGSDSWNLQTTPGTVSVAAAGKIRLGAASGSTPANRWGQSYDGSAFTPFVLSPTTHFISYEGICQNTTASFSLDTPTSNAPAATCVTGSNVVNRGTLNFDASVDETVYGSFLLPSDWTGNIDLEVEGDAAEAGTNVARLSIATACVADTETADPAFNNTAQTFAWTNTNSGQRVTATQTALTTTGCAAGERLFFKFFRDADGTSGTDSLGVDLRVWALRFKYRRAQ